MHHQFFIQNIIILIISSFEIIKIQAYINYNAHDNNCSFDFLNILI
jgi:hypothetical protein